MNKEDICVNIINLPHRTDRKESAIKQMQGQEITNYRLCPGVLHPQSFTGISKAYKNIIREAKSKGDNMCCIAEDDVIFSDKNSWNYFIENIPDDFCIYLASIYWGDVASDNTVKEFSGFTLTIFHSRFYEQLLRTNEGNHIDREMKTHGGIYKVCNPFCAYQIDGFSDNSQQVTNYFDTYLKGKKFYHSTF